MDRLIWKKGKEKSFFFASRWKARRICMVGKGNGTRDMTITTSSRTFDPFAPRSRVPRIERKRFRWRIMSFLDLGYVVYDLQGSLYTRRVHTVRSMYRRGYVRLGYYSRVVILGQATGCSPLLRIQYDARRDGNNAWTSDRWNSSRSIASPNDLPCHLLSLIARLYQLPTGFSSRLDYSLPWNRKRIGLARGRWRRDSSYVSSSNMIASFSTKRTLSIHLSLSFPSFRVTLLQRYVAVQRRIKCKWSTLSIRIRQDICMQIRERLIVEEFLKENLRVKKKEKEKNISGTAEKG